MPGPGLLVAAGSEQNAEGNDEQARTHGNAFAVRSAGRIDGCQYEGTILRAGSPTWGAMTSQLPLRCQACGLVVRSGIDACPFRDTRRSAGTILIHQGAKPTSVLYLRRGQVVLSSTAASGTEVSCAVRGPDTLLGLEALMDLTMPYQVWALTDVALCTLDGHAFKAWLGSEKSPTGAALMFSLQEAARRVGERQALQGTALRRVARFLLQHSEVSTDGEPLRTPHRVLAGILGMRPETLSRALAELRDGGALATGRSVRVTSKDRLRQLAGD